jgi:hypothetical protein
MLLVLIFHRTFEFEFSKFSRLMEPLVNFSKQFLWFIKTLVVVWLLEDFEAQLGLRNWVWFHSLFYCFIIGLHQGWQWSHKRFYMSDDDPTKKININGDMFWRNCLNRLKNNKKFTLDIRNLAKIPLWLNAT